MAPIERTAEHISLGKGYNKEIFLPQYSLSHLLAYIFKILKKDLENIFTELERISAFVFLIRSVFARTSLFADPLKLSFSTKRS